MRIGFFGTPEIASHCLDGLCSLNTVEFVVTNPDRPAGRNRHIRCCAAKETAECRHIPVLQPVNLNDRAFMREIASFNADIFVVVAYGSIIPRAVFDMPPLGTINMHPSLLPLYRGAAPIEWAIMNGETHTGVTVQRINEQLDSGDIVVQQCVDIPASATAEEMYAVLTQLGYQLLEKAIEGLGDNSLMPYAQDHARATYYGKIDKNKARIQWDADAVTIHNLIRGLNPKPAAWTHFRDAVCKIYRSKILNPDDLVNYDCNNTIITENISQPAPGEIVRYQKKRLIVGTGSGLLEIVTLQPEGKKIMDALSFINGARLSEGEFFQ